MDYAGVLDFQVFWFIYSSNVYRLRYEYCHACACKCNLNKNIPAIKKERPRAKKALFKTWNRNGRPRPPAFDKTKIFDHHDLTAKHCYFGCLRSPDGTKLLIKMTRWKTLRWKTMFCSLVIFIKNFDPINIKRPWAPEITMFGGEVMMIKIFSPIKSRRPWSPILISHLYPQGLFSSWPLLFLHLGCFCLDFTFF